MRQKLGLGAKRRDILRLILGQRFRLVLVCITIDKAGAYALTCMSRIFTSGSIPKTHNKTFTRSRWERSSIDSYKDALRSGAANTLGTITVVYSTTTSGRGGKLSLSRM